MVELPAIWPGIWNQQFYYCNSMTGNLIPVFYDQEFDDWRICKNIGAEYLIENSPITSKNKKQDDEKKTAPITVEHYYSLSKTAKKIYRKKLTRHSRIDELYSILPQHVPNVPKEHKKTRYRKRKDIENQAKRQKIENQNTFPLNSIETLPSTNNPSSFSLVFPESTTNIENELKDPMPSTNTHQVFLWFFQKAQPIWKTNWKIPILIHWYIKTTKKYFNFTPNIFCDESPSFGFSKMIFSKSEKMKIFGGKIIFCYRWGKNPKATCSFLGLYCV